MMLDIFYPDETCSSVYEIDFEQRYGQGIRGLIFDIDNTLVTHGARQMRDAAVCLSGFTGWDLRPAFFQIISWSG